MPFNGSGTFVRTQNWTNDANNNLPISATKFDNEDSDFASGLSLCLTRDGQGAPTSALTWTQALTLNGSTGSSPLKVGCTGGANNPALQVEVLDGSGVTLNLTTAQAIALAIQGTSVLTATATALTAAQPLTAPEFIPTSATIPANGLYLPAANTLGLAAASTLALSVTSAGISIPGTLGVTGNSTLTGTLAVSAGGSSIKGQLSLSAPATSIATLTVASASGAQDAATFSGASGAAASIGLIDGQTGTREWSLLSGYPAAGNFALYDRTASAIRLKIDTSGIVWVPDDGGTLQAVGYRGLPVNPQTGNYTAQLSDRGKLIVMQTPGTTLTVPNGVFSNSDSFSVMTNFTSGSITIAQATGVSIFWANGSGNTSGNRTLTGVGVATIAFHNAPACIVSGGGLS